MTDDQIPTPDPSDVQPPTSPIEEAVAEATPPPAEATIPAPAAPERVDTPAAPERPDVTGAERVDDITPPPVSPVLTKLRDPFVIAAIALALLTVLLALMVFAPRVAPLKLGATKLAAKAQEEQEIVTAAKRFAKSFVTIDYRTIDADFRRMQADTTGGFKERLTETKNLIKGPFKTAKAHSTGKALDAAVISHQKDSAVVQVLLQRTKSNKSLKHSQSCNQVVNVSLTQTGDGWKIDNLSELGSPTCK